MLAPVLAAGLLAAPAQAQPRVALLAPGRTPTEVDLLRAGLEASGARVRVVGEEELPLVGPAAAQARARAEAAAALASAHAAFVDTRFAEARAQAAAAEANARPWAHDPRVAQLLAELALVAAQSGDPKALERAAAYAPDLALDAARYSPTVRQRFAEAQAHRRAQPLAPTPTPAPPTPAPPTLAPPTLAPPGGQAEPIAAPSAPAPAASPLSLDEPARLAALRLRLTDRAPVAESELALAARHFSCDAALAVSGDPPRALIAGPALPAAAEPADARPLSDVAAALGRRLQTACTLAHRPPERVRAGSLLALAVDAGPCVARVHAEARLAAGPLQLTAPVERGAARLTLALPSSAQAYTLPYRLWGESAQGSAVAALGSASAPLHLLVEPDRKPPRRWYQRWWVWTIAGGALTAAAVITAVSLYRPPSEARLVGE